MEEYSKIGAVYIKTAGNLLHRPGQNDIEIGVDFLGFRASPADAYCNWAIGIISIFFIIGNGDDGSQQDPHKEPGGCRPQ